MDWQTFMIVWGEKMNSKPRIMIDLKDGLADVYAFATLYEYLLEREFPADIEIFGCGDCRVSFIKLMENKGKDTNLYSGGHYDLYLKGYSDLTCTLKDKEIAIDLSILKNCVEPVSEEERKELRRNYEVPEDRPILVVGCPSSNYQGNNFRKIVRRLDTEAIIYFVGTVDIPKNRIGILEGKVIEECGVLKEYYKIADITMINANISKVAHMKHMHNFVEATAGGPLFLVKPENTSQYGYKQLVQREVIREAENTDDLIAKVKKYLENPQGEQIREQRRQHLELSRRNYLPEMERLLKNLLKISEEPFESDLEFEFTHKHYTSRLFPFDVNALRIIHPETTWDSYLAFNESLLRASGDLRPLKEFNAKQWSEK